MAKQKKELKKKKEITDAKPNLGGRPLKHPYDEEMAIEICEAVATSPLSMAKILEANPHFPNEQAIRMWRYKIEQFREMWAEAKRAQAELYVEQCMPIADDSSDDVIIDSNGNEIMNGEFVARSKLRIDMRKWVGVKLVPRIYGDKIKLETNDNSKKAARDIKSRMDKIKKHERDY